MLILHIHYSNSSSYIPIPNPLMLSGAKYGRTVESDVGIVLHCTEEVGHTGLGHGAGAGHTA